MLEELWAGVDRKISNARFFLEEMGRSLQPTRVITAGVPAEMPLQWEQSFYARLDAFLAMARSVPDIIQWGFGVDVAMRDKTWLKPWFDSLAASEQGRREEFSKRFKPPYDAFRSLALTNARNISLHRKGYPPVELNITGRFGVSYVGSPVKGVPGAESRPISADDDPADPAVLWAATELPVPVRPMWTDFTIGGKPLFAECRAYLAQAEQLATQARGIAERVHGTDVLTPSP
jgi:hypothetical protein